MKRIVSLLLVAGLLCTALTGLALAQEPDLEIQEFPASGDMYEMMDLSDPYKTVISGLFRQDITEGGLDRECYVYISPENRQEYTGTREDLVAQGYSPCGRCKP